MRFEKWQALGNDYMIVEHDAPPFELTPARIEKICAYHFGVGADGILLIEPRDARRGRERLRIFNPDGSEAELSGNGIREAIMYLRRPAGTDLDEFAVGTAAGVIRPKIVSETECAVDMGRASLTSKDFPDGPPDGRGTIAVGFTDLEFQHVSIGNPQCAIEIPGDDRDLDGARRWAASARASRPTSCSRIAPTCRFWQRTGERAIKARIFERGVGETLSSGTGATGAAVAAYLRGRRRARSPSSSKAASWSSRSTTTSTSPSPAGPSRSSPASSRRNSSTELREATWHADPVKRLERIPPYLFAELEQKIADEEGSRNRRDQPGHRRPRHAHAANVVEAVPQAVADPSTHQYPSNRGRAEFRQAVADFYARRFGVRSTPRPR